MPDSPFTALVHNAALLLALVLAYDLVVSRYPLANKTGRQLAIGALLGAMGVGIMLAPFQLMPGIVFDTRSVLLAIAGMFFGFVPTLVAMLLTALYRLTQGGPAAGVGVAVIIASGSLGLLWRRHCRKALADVNWRQLYGLGLAVHVVMLLLMLSLGWPTARDVLATIGLPVLVIYPVATTALGLLLANQLRREQAAMAQQESEQRWQFALEGAGDGVWDWDVRANTVFFSKRWKQMLGYADHEIGRGLEEWSGRVHPEDLPQALADVQAHLEGRAATYSNEHRMRCQDGSYKWIHDRGLVVSRDAGGKARRMVGTHADITARKEAEAAAARQRQELQTLVRQLENSRGMLQSIIESIPMRVFWKDKDLRYQGCNRLFAHDAGFREPAELQGKDDQAMGWSAQAELYQKDDREVMATGLPHLNILEPQTTPAGATIWLNTSKVPLKDSDGTVVGLLGIYADITTRMRMEQELRESQLVYRSFVEQLPAAVFRKDRAGRYVMVNPVFCRLKGLPAEAFLGKTATEVAAMQLAQHGPDSWVTKYATAGDEIHEQILRTGQAVEAEEQYHATDGGTIYMHVVRMPVFAPDGTVVGVQGIQIDLTSRRLAEMNLAATNRTLQAEMEESARAVAQARAAQKEMTRLLSVAERSRRALLSVVEDHRAAEQALRKSEERYRLIADNTDDVIWLYDLKSDRFTYCSPSVIKMRGYTAEEVLTQRMLDMLTPESGERVTRLLRESVARYAAGDHSVRTQVHVVDQLCRGGRLVPTEVSATLLADADGQVTQLLGVSRDITLQVAARETLERFNMELEQKVELRTEELAARTRQVQALLNAIPDTVMVLAADGTILQSQPAHQSSAALAAITPAANTPAPAGAPAELLAASLQLGHRALAEKTTVTGETEIATTGGALALELRTAPTGTREFVVFARDITARKRLEVETAAMLEKERQVSEMKSRFVSVTSHEFRTPMTAIMGSIELLANHLDHLTEAKRTQIFERINGSLRRMAEMLDDVLTLNRMDANRTEVRLAGVNLTPFVHNIIQEIRAGDHDAHVFAVHVPEDTAPFVTDPNILHHILSNLIGNAVRYSAAGTTVTVRVHPDAWRMQLSVGDQGIGIPPGDSTRIFEPFERGSNVGHIKGTGLGLNIVKRMTGLLGGSISFQPVAGGGTCFTLVFPLAPPPTPPSP